MLSRSQVLEIDRRAIEEFGLAGVVLMENAGRGVVEVMQQLGITGPVHIVCGKGNNAGDGFVIARHLELLGTNVIVHRCSAIEELTGDAAINYRIIERSGVTIVPYTSVEMLGQRLKDASWIVDALLGTGLTGTVRSPFAEIIRCMNGSGKPILAVDLPSGMDADTGEPLGEVVIAQQTVTFVAAKMGFGHQQAGQYTGRVHVASIGSPRCLLAEYGVVR
ncbi:MAG TPA: NAD(P)H-hydrate epimerase [Gemmatales bacterium]|nr:NAD(P)H-hydrate epimerase [Gemmatales bacterium]